MLNGGRAALDDVNLKILNLLQEDARTSFSAIGREVGLTPTAVAERVRRLREAGVVRGFHASVDSSRLGFGITAFVRFAARQGASIQVVRECERLPEVIECHRVTGEDTYLLKVLATSVPHLEDILIRLRPLGTSTTSIVLSSPVEHRAVVPHAERSVTLGPAA